MHLQWQYGRRSKTDNENVYKFSLNGLCGRTFRARTEMKPEFAQGVNYLHTPSMKLKFAYEGCQANLTNSDISMIDISNPSKPRLPECIECLSTIIETLYERLEEHRAITCRDLGLLAYR